MPLWWKKPDIYRPFGPTFNIRRLDTALLTGSQLLSLSMPEGAYYQLIHLSYDYTRSIGGVNVYDIINAYRGQKLLMRCTGQIQGGSNLKCIWSTGGPTIPLSMGSTIQEYPLPQDFYLYPSDVLEFGRDSADAAPTYSNLAITVKEWPYDH